MDVVDLEALQSCDCDGITRAGGCVHERAADEITRLRAEVERKDAALADFVAMGEQYGWDAAMTGRDILMRNARAALTTQDKEP